MKCPYCASFSNRVVDKRLVKGIGDIRRRRECLKCAKRFTTYEKLAELDFVVIKRDGRHETFNRDKLRLGVEKALQKRPAFDRVDSVVERIERRLRRRGNKEIPSKFIGQMVLLELKKIDAVAYLRFVSVYRQFESVNDFAKELTTIAKI
ncbi:transcriptional regulator NrdR [Candidatus Daviesbacteria bacterium RIFCSPLOWO2_02_FULL_40_8]|uniref:Transcriptional repressor NrdR n=1 Tax=Candidatus Daviesbacteria bacterium RIFCSPLOWO2_01_FULL_40_24 TaxID=1797787 RepID=A0A1F5MID6_9BACT|nr:MAG: transcriptional regulator NrdR [Candidatus Daviesbacteria bacterium RIFCSPHIGHO2_01_FULL_41_45]OGE34157.1 MAG: transcriptional regulator NrdR [Candidatus Daviesbacteria bacterium RIFCSPHIGHO2_02_FULL_41_14]OGE65141.1 MAG: transcriptional regulator NrdR [Candidatus Daviesbacteria bacterium RIFCSPLOWO2_01_FULL_40_24]OGE66906.1 MAG: transcriptional regulator NrdR [Candidatus Daviesbacteria bacterium RIFCSPLOWO2_02_FULL_40_8]